MLQKLMLYLFLTVANSNGQSLSQQKRLYFFPLISMSSFLVCPPGPLAPNVLELILKTRDQLSEVREELSIPDEDERHNIATENRNRVISHHIECALSHMQNIVTDCNIDCNAQSTASHNKHVSSGPFFCSSMERIEHQVRGSPHSHRLVNVSPLNVGSSVASSQYLTAREITESVSVEILKLHMFPAVSPSLSLLGELNSVQRKSDCSNTVNHRSTSPTVSALTDSSDIQRLQNEVPLVVPSAADCGTPPSRKNKIKREKVKTPVAKYLMDLSFSRTPRDKVFGVAQPRIVMVLQEDGSMLQGQE
jgi:hypothetical protein